MSDRALTRKSGTNSVREVDAAPANVTTMEEPILSYPRDADAAAELLDDLDPSD